MQADAEPQARNEQLIRLIAHDLRNPLTAVQLNGQLIERTAAKAGREREQRWARSIVDAARRMDDMLGKLVECERIRSGRIPLPLAAVNLDVLVREAAERHHGSALRFDLVAQAPAPINANRARLVQALESLVGLAAQEPGGNAAIRVESGANAGRAHCRICVPNRPVADEPAGTAGESDGPPPNSGGQAIALHHARTLIESHGGTLDIAQDDCKTTFTIELPLASSPSPTSSL